MYISNADKITQGKVYKCGQLVGKYLIKQGIPLLSQQDNYMVFSKTKRLQKALDDMPFYLKILVKGGVIDG